jgi:NAD(P)H dehydrogenase (quinone)
MKGMPPERARMLLGLYRASRAGEFAVTDPTLEQLMGQHW